LTSEERQAIKAARDKVVRARINRENRMHRGPKGQCKECGTDYANWTVGCKTCSYRHYHWWRDGNDGTTYGTESTRLPLAYYLRQHAAHLDITMRRPHMTAAARRAA